jgi:tRNA-dihydrouridine synthase B
MKHEESNHAVSKPDPLIIGKVSIDPPLVAAPMAGVTDAPYRRLLADYGAGLVTTGMISAEGIRRKQRASWNLCSQEPRLSIPLSVQLFGSDPSVVAEAARMIEQSGAALVDINAGCPVRKVVRQGAGASLLRKPDLLAAMVEEVRKAVSIPVTVKVRLGWDGNSIGIIETVKRLSSAGADAIAIHARTAQQQYRGQADWEWIRKAKASADIPIIGNGDIASPGMADSMLRETGCDGVMIGRAAMGNPWLIDAIASQWGRWSKGDRSTGWMDFYRTACTHAEAFLSEKPACIGHYRMILIWYSKGCPDAGQLRSKLMSLNRRDDILGAFRAWVENVAEKGVDFLPSKISKVLPVAPRSLDSGDEPFNLMVDCL